jgi:hypothetical protein
MFSLLLLGVLRLGDFRCTSLQSRGSSLSLCRLYESLSVPSHGRLDPEQMLVISNGKDLVYGAPHDEREKECWNGPDTKKSASVRFWAALFVTMFMYLQLFTSGPCGGIHAYLGEVLIAS